MNEGSTAMRLVLGAVVAIAAFVAMERFKLGVIPVLGACAVLGVVLKLLPP